MKPQNYLKIDYRYLPAKVHIYSKGVLVKKWSETEPANLIDEIIDGMDDSVFNKIKIKKLLYQITEIIDPASIKIIQKES